MAPKRAWQAEDGTVFVERDDGGREIIRDVGGERKLYETKAGEDNSDDSSCEDLARDDA